MQNEQTAVRSPVRGAGPGRWLAEQPLPQQLVGEGSCSSPTPGTAATEQDDRASGAAVTIKRNEAWVAQQGGGRRWGRVAATRPVASCGTAQVRVVQLQLHAGDQVGE